MTLLACVAVLPQGANTRPARSLFVPPKQPMCRHCLNCRSASHPTIAPWRRDQLVRQLKVFPQGQLVAVRDGQLLGCASSLVIVWDEWADEHTWKQITASGTFQTHNPKGFTLYGAEVFVDPQARGQRVRAICCTRGVGNCAGSSTCGASLPVGGFRATTRWRMKCRWSCTQRKSSGAICRTPC